MRQGYTLLECTWRSGTDVDRFDLVAYGEHEGLWDWDLVNNRIHFSRRWDSILGCKEGSFGNKPEEWFRRIHPEDLEQVQREIDAHIENGSLQFTMQHRMLHKDGSYRWMLCRGVITRDKTGKAIRIAGCHMDITAEKVVDTLTGLPNRLLLLDRLTRSIEMTKRHSDFLFAVFILDLDRPERLTDDFGSVAEDSLLAAVARRLETCLRTGYTVTHPGRDHLIAHSCGYEFIVLVNGLHQVGEAKTVAERLLKEVSVPFELNGREVFLSANIGIALSATGYRRAEEALQDADTALYRAKSLGKGRCEVFDTAILESSLANLGLEIDLQWALERRELAVAYQPIVSLASNRIAGFEALVRWNHPVRGVISPAEFIPLTERTGFIVPLGRWIIHEACSQLKTWKKNPQISRELWVSVNLSAVQFRHPDFVREIRDVLLDVDLEANSLMLELTEGGVMENPEAANRVLMQLRVMGARIALDDFGTGYSSLAHLSRFPLDFLKIDRSFVRKIQNNNDGREIIRSISSLAHQLGLRVIAEGIENLGQLNLIRSLDCEYGQGYFFSQAVDDEQACALLKSSLELRGRDNDIVIGTKERELKRNPPFHEVSAVHVSRFGTTEPPIEATKDQFQIRRAPIFIGLASIMLLFIGGLWAILHNLAHLPVVYSARSGASSAAETSTKKTAEKLSTGDVQVPLSEDVKPKPLSVVPKTSRKKIPVSVCSYEVIHDHLFGNCKGTLKATRDTLSYISEKKKCSFSLEYGDYSYVLERNQLAIKTASKTYHFKSANAMTEEENKSQLQDIVQNIAKFHEESVSRDKSHSVSSR